MVAVQVVRVRACGLLLTLCLALSACGNATARPQPLATDGVPFSAIPAACTIPPASGATLSLATNASGAPAVTTLSTNVTGPNDVDPLLASYPLLTQWNPPLIRLHFGFIYDSAGLLPEGRAGHWDFTKLDAIISRLNARHLSFYLEVRTAPPWMFDATGQLRDQSFQEYATYLARLVGWYDAGGFTDDAGVYHASGHFGWVNTWEIWNEPNSGYEIPAPVANRAATWMEPAAFAQLYDVVVTAMLRVAPTVRIGGPTLSSYPDIPYLRTFIESITAPLSFLSFHFYAIGNPQAPDSAIFAAIDGPRYLGRIQAARQLLDAARPGQDIPIWIDEVGVDELAGTSGDPRGTTPLGYAFLGRVFALAMEQGVAKLNQYPFVGTSQLALVDFQARQPFRTYWLVTALARAFPAGGKLIPVTLGGAASGALTALAEIAPDGKSLRLLLVSTQVARATDNNGPGVPVTVTARLAGVTAGTVASVQVFDAAASVISAPAPCAKPVAATGTLTIPVGGYGATIVTMPLP